MNAGRVHPDWKWALLVALVLLSIASFVVFVIHPGGFETQIGWFYGLLPGAFLGQYWAYHLSGIASILGLTVQWSATLVISFLWYWVIGYGLIKIYRVAMRLPQL